MATPSSITPHPHHGAATASEGEHLAARRLAADRHVHVWNDHGDWSECIDCDATAERAVA